MLKGSLGTRLRLATCIAGSPATIRAPGHYHSLDLSKWQSELQGHPHPAYAEFITRGIQYSFRVGFNYSLDNLQPCRKNLQLTTQHPSVVDAYLRNKFSKTVSPALRTHPPYSGFNQMPLVSSPNVTNQENGG